MIAKKPLAAAPKRLQCLMSRLMQYDVEIKYKRGPELYLSDTLSRAYLLLEHLPWKADQEVERKPLREIREETAKDPVLQSLKAVILNGWTNQRERLPIELRQYFIVRDELAAQECVFFKGLKSVIPMSLRPKIKEKLHRSHIGIQGCLRGARELSIGLTWTENWKNLSQSVKLTTPSSLFNRKSL